MAEEGKLVVHGSGAVEEVVKKTSHDQGAIRTMCRPGIFTKVVNGLSEEQKNVIRGMGFGTLIELKIKNISRRFVRHLCMHLAINENCFIFPEIGMRIPISWHDVAHVMGVPSAGEIFAGINTKSSDRFECWIHLVKHLKPEIGYEREFKVKFMQFALATVLDPVANFRGCKKTFNVVSQRVMHFPKSYNWAKFMFGRLMSGIRTWQASTNIDQTFLTGSLVFLELFYVMKMHITTIPGIPHVERSVLWTDELVRKRLNMEYKTFASFGNGTIQYFPYGPTEPTERPPIFANPQVEIAAALPEAEESNNPMDTLSDEDIRRLIIEKQALKRKLEDEINDLVDYFVKKKAKKNSTNVPPYFNPQRPSSNVGRDEIPNHVNETAMPPVTNAQTPSPKTSSTNFQSKLNTQTSNINVEQDELHKYASETAMPPVNKPQSSLPKTSSTIAAPQFIPDTSNTNVEEDEIPIPTCEMTMQAIPNPQSSYSKQPSNEHETVEQVCKIVPPSSIGSPQSYNAKETEDGMNAKAIGQGDNDESGHNEVERCVTSNVIQDKDDDDDDFVNPPLAKYPGAMREKETYKEISVGDDADDDFVCRPPSKVPVPKEKKTSEDMCGGNDAEDDFVCPPPTISTAQAPHDSRTIAEIHAEKQDDTVAVCPPVLHKAPVVRKGKSKRKAANPRREILNKSKFVKSRWVTSVKRQHTVLVSKGVVDYNLTEDDFNLAHFCLVDDEDLNIHALIRCNGLFLYRDYIHCFADNEWLSGEVVNMFVEILNEENKAQCDQLNKRTRYYFSSIFSQQVECVQQDTSKDKILDLFGYLFFDSKMNPSTVSDFLIIPHCLGSHWAFHVVDLDFESIYCYDTLPNSIRKANNKAFKEKLAKVLNVTFQQFQKEIDYNFDTFIYTAEKTTRQKDPNNCGFLMMKLIQNFNRGMGDALDASHCIYYRLQLLKHMVFSQHNELRSQVIRELHDVYPLR